MFLGMAYHPEYWPRERWPLDARLMREANIEAVRVGEFSWDRFEPREGEFDFGWMDAAVDIFAREGIQTIMCTPTATPPAWLIHRHPEILPIDEHGLVAKPFGARRHYCCNVPVFQQYTRTIVTAMAEHYGGNPNVIGWQIDNEVGNVYMLSRGRCYCESCRTKFSAWLKRKFGTLDALNEAWGNVFWSQEYSDWDQIVLPSRGTVGEGLNPSHVLDFYRFFSDSWADYTALQADILRDALPEAVDLDQLCVWPGSRDDGHAGRRAVPGRLRVVSLRRGLDPAFREPRLSRLEFARGRRGRLALGRFPARHPARWEIRCAGGRRHAHAFLPTYCQGRDRPRPLHMA